MSLEEIRELERRTQTDRRDADAWQKLALLHERMGQREAAWRACLSAIAEAGLEAAESLPLARAVHVPLAVLPSKDGHVLVASDGERIALVAELPFPSDTRPALAGDLVAGFVDTSASEPDRVLVLSLTEKLATVGSFDLPADFTPHAITLGERAVYAGGSSERNKLVVTRDLARPDAGWHETTFPPEAARHGKAVDALVLDGSRLLAVDNIAEPKWIFVLDASEPAAPRVISSTDLGLGVNEHVVTASLDGNWLAVLERYANVNGSGSNIDLYDRDEVQRRASILSQHLRWNTPGSPRTSWFDALVVGDALVIASGPVGFAILDLATHANPRRGLVLDPQDPGSFWPRAKIPENSLRWARTSEPIQRLARLPGVRAIAAATPTGFRCVSFAELGIDQLVG